MPQKSNSSLNFMTFRIIHCTYIKVIIFLPVGKQKILKFFIFFMLISLVSVRTLSLSESLCFLFLYPINY